MKVKLLAYTKPIDTAENVEYFVASCAKGCYSEKPSSELIQSANEKYLTTLDHIISSGHGSVIEHLSFTFSIEGISRACANQLVRHRIASYSQQSQRYVNIKKTWENIVIPHSVKDIIDEEFVLSDTKKDEEMCNAIENYKEALRDLLDEMDLHNIPSEDMRYFVPIGAKTNVTVTMNARSLFNFFTWRCCKQAQWEIREVAEEMLKICKDIAPTIFKTAGPQCVRGECKEGKRSCKTKSIVKDGHCGKCDHGVIKVTE